jgi:hypothetical protein
MLVTMSIGKWTIGFVHEPYIKAQSDCRFSKNIPVAFPPPFRQESSVRFDLRMREALRRRHAYYLGGDCKAYSSLKPSDRPYMTGLIICTLAIAPACLHYSM